jgi:hypothetical protein
MIEDGIPMWLHTQVELSVAGKSREEDLRSILPEGSLQVLLVGFTAASLFLFLNILGAGFLGHPEMFISGNDSTAYALRWYQAHVDSALPRPGCVSVSIWCYRLLMLAWALWLASSLIRWLTWGWAQFSAGGLSRKNPKKMIVPPILPRG